ncbi:glutamate ABC transporter substrate-binding protein [Ornithinimicrobium sp. INDO-MA30-4]|uniref:glutamate ABC transporter substrate-binding protein n=1 Tax=Ornithinimicrobium sp. INDO-MA30-4 TaxID=2908651 RepID=UPI001F4491CF|nr:glutamate ABC transporter substrate-binding protein [Ornithinimicrobium sp. INDO-MA30-4]UJH70913.1 glutamate ABC transporter substrate-binding protein [Ornithinimicrobium sp. INDO-MA30-4]
MKRATFRLAGVLAASSLALAACGSDDGGSDDAGSSEASGDGITVGIKFDQPGLGLKDGDNYSGMDVDTAIAVAAELGYTEDQITWKESPSAQRETLLETGQVDMIFATYSITNERKEKVQFAGPYFVAGQDLLVSADSDIASLDDLDGKLLCSVTGSTSANNVSDAVPGVQLQEYGTYSECVSQLANGTIDALTTDDTILAGYAAQEQYAGQLTVVGVPFSEERYGVGLPKESEQCEEINEIVAGFWEDGTMDQIIEDNFGSDYSPNADLNPPQEMGVDCG